MKPFFALGILLLVAGGEAFAAAGHEQFVERTSSRMDALRSAPASARAGGCTRLYRQAFDLDALAEATAKGRWAGMGGSLRAALADAVGRRLTSECLRLLRRPYAGPPKIRRTRSAGRATKVTVEHVDGKGRQTVVVWTLVPGGPLAMRALDVVGEGRGLVAALRADFEGALTSEGGNVGAAIERLARGR